MLTNDELTMAASTKHTAGPAPTLNPPRGRSSPSRRNEALYVTRPDLERFRETLIRAMVAKNMSAAELARAVWGEIKDPRGYMVPRNRDRLTHYMSGSAHPNPENLAKIAKALDLDPADLAIDASKSHLPRVVLSPAGETPPAYQTKNRLYSEAIKAGTAPPATSAPPDTTPPVDHTNSLTFYMLDAENALFEFRRILPIALATRLLGQITEMIENLKTGEDTPAPTAASTPQPKDTRTAA